MAVDTRVALGLVSLCICLLGFCIVSRLPEIIGYKFFALSVWLVSLGSFATAFIAGLYGLVSRYETKFNDMLDTLLSITKASTLDRALPVYCPPFPK